MFRPATRLIARPSALRAVPRAAAPARRFLSTAPPAQKSRSWKSLAARIGILGTIIYYYNTTEVFAEEPAHAVEPLPVTDEEVATLPTLEDIAKEKQRRKEELAAAQQQQKEAKAQEGDDATEGGIGELEEEAGQQGAFNPETGEINWDCPCLGGMATGPCGEQFKAAFSCFVYSTEEPKGMDCIDKFKDMQNCFREYPEVYGAELEGADDDDEEGASAAALEDAQPEPKSSADHLTSPKTEPKAREASDSAARQGDNKHKDHRLVPQSYRPGSEDGSKNEKATKESDELFPKAAVDATAANAGKN